VPIPFPNQSKGLEFDDVFLVNFCSDSPVKEEWRLLLQASRPSPWHSTVDASCTNLYMVCCLLFAQTQRCCRGCLPETLPQPPLLATLVKPVVRQF
jgi:hypothetical protein